MNSAEVEYDDWLPLLDKWQTSVKKGARERGDLRIKAVWYGPDLVSLLLKTNYSKVFVASIYIYSKNFQIHFQNFFK